MPEVRSFDMSRPNRSAVRAYTAGLAMLSLVFTSLFLPGWASPFTRVAEAAAPRILINEFRRDDALTTNEYVEFLLTEDFTAAQLEAVFFGDSTAAVTTKFSVVRFQNMASIAPTFKAGTIIVVGGATSVPVQETIYAPAIGGTDDQWNLRLRLGGGFVSETSGNAFNLAGTEVIWVDNSSTGVTSIDSIGWPTTAIGTLINAARVKIAAPPNVSNVEFMGDADNTSAANYALSSPGSVGLPNGGLNTTYVNSLRGGTTPTPSPDPTPDPSPSPSPSPSPDPGIDLIINEIDSDTPGTDVAEFVEIYDGGKGNTSLNGLSMVFYNGSTGLSYRAIDLSGGTTDSQGYLTVGNSAVPGVDITFPNGTLQNGQDAVAIYAAPAASFPNGTQVTLANLVDAIVYDTDDSDGASVLPLLNAGQGSVNENTGGQAATLSNQRCPNGEGGRRNTDAYLQRSPSPGAANNCPAPPVFKKISEIQGSTNVSPFDGAAVITNGIVTALKSNGFFLQEPDATVDGDPATSEGILVFTNAVPSAVVGDFVTVTGNAVEFNGLTEINAANANVVVSGSGNPLPTPVVLTTTILNPSGPVDQLERFEGMRVAADRLVSVAPTNGFGEIFTVLDGVARPMREPGIDITDPLPPDPTTGVPDCCVPRWDRNPERIMVDTNGLAGFSIINVTSNVVLENIVGPLDYNFGDYKIDPEVAPVVASPNMTPVPVRAAVGTEFSVAGYNIENFTGNPVQAQKASLAVRTVMNMPDVVGVIEISTLAALQNFADKVNQDAIAAGGSNPAYVAYLVPAPAGGTQNVGFLVKSSKIRVDSVEQEQGLRQWITPTGASELLHDRPPLVLYATVNASADPRPIVVVVNHLRSFIDIELLDPTGARVRAKRKAQAEATAELLQSLQTDNAGTPVISVGDYNSYQFSDGYTDPIATLKGTPTADEEIVVDGSPDLVDPNYANLVDSLPADQQYSFIFEGTPQAIDHVLVNGAAASIVKDFGITRMNADFPEAANVGDPNTPLNNSDHDSPVAIFQFAQRATTTTVPNVTVTYNVSGQNVLLSASVATDINTVNEGTVTFTVTDAGGQVVGTVGPVTVTDGSATANFALPGSVPPQELTITAEFSGGPTTLASTGTGKLIVTYAVCLAYDPTRAVNSGAVYPIRLRLCDVNGVNLSASHITVRASGIESISAPDTDLEAEDAGNANPDGDFRYDASLQGYIFNLKTSGLAPGVYRLNFSAGLDPTTHSVEFRVR